MENCTPMMKQYLEIKDRHQDAILFFRLGDFYEMFFEDALTASRELEITLTGRNCGLDEKAPMCGVPFHSADNYIHRLVEKGYKVAICEQVEDPELAKGIVQRDVVRIVTPGTMLNEKTIDSKTNNFICALYYNISNSHVGISYSDVSTGEFKTTEAQSFNDVMDVFSKINPSEVIVNADDPSFVDYIKLNFKGSVTLSGEWRQQLSKASEIIKGHLHVFSLESLGIDGRENAILSTGMLFDYLHETQKNALIHINALKYYELNYFMVLDQATRLNLELTETIRGKQRVGSLFGVLDKTKTSMGGRLLKQYIHEPLVDIGMIEERLDFVQAFAEDLLLQNDVVESLKGIYDIERIISKVAYGNCNARDFLSLKNSLGQLPELKNVLSSAVYDNVSALGQKIDCMGEIVDLLARSIAEEPPLSIKEGNIISDGYDTELDELRYIIANGKEWIATLENKEREATGIKNLKIGYNKVFGYYLEITKSNLGLAPDYYIRKQTLANAERYITPELKEMEAKILGAEEKILKREYELFLEIRDLVAKEMDRLKAVSALVARIDVFCALGKVAYTNDYVRPQLNNEGICSISDGRHPVVEDMMGHAEFIANDVALDMQDNQIAIITGPNMAGKSTYMRQVALIQLMAQIGCFVPASQANLAIVDRIFTRIGASDDLSQGKSTFMVEMTEVANILNNCTDHSLLILDEIGRGTSTYDGLSIAWSVIDYIHSHVKAKTLFATHYHELTELEETMAGVKNYNISVKENQGNIVFLRKIIKGCADRSYGIEVAKLAGVPQNVIDKAKLILDQLENNDLNRKKPSEMMVAETSAEIKQLDFLSVQESSINDELTQAVKNIDVANTTPLEALNILYQLKKMV